MFLIVAFFRACATVFLMFLAAWFLIMAMTVMTSCTPKKQEALAQQDLSQRTFSKGTTEILRSRSIAPKKKTPPVVWQKKEVKK